MILVRWRAWWFNKVPLWVFLVLLVLDGRPFSSTALLALAAVVLTVCAGSNFAYALNELFDQDEDGKIGRSNAAAGVPAGRMWLVILGSAGAAFLISTLAGGVPGLILCAATLCLPPLYSMPPLRFKERMWLGVVSDALAAHAAPAALTLLVVSHLALRPVFPGLVAAALGWSFLVGLRGILSHQLNSAEADAAAGLKTVASRLGEPRLEALIVRLILPAELGFLVCLMALCRCGPVLWGLAIVYLLAEAAKVWTGRFETQVLRRPSRSYVPFVEESFYKTWGPMILPMDAARHDLIYLTLLPAFILFFRPLVEGEKDRLKRLRLALADSRPKLEPARFRLSWRSPRRQRSPPWALGSGASGAGSDPGRRPSVPVQQAHLGQQPAQSVTDTIVPDESDRRQLDVVDAQVPE